MSHYFDEIERMWEITKGVDGFHNDPNDAKVVIFQNGGMIMRIPKEVVVEIQNKGEEK